MGWLVAQGAFFAIGIVIGLVMTAIGLFVGHIILFDSIALAVVSAVCCNQFLDVHPAFCLLIGIAAFAVLFFLQHTRFGFWLIGGLLSAAWAFVFAFLAYVFSGEDMIWFYVIFGLALVLMIWLHLRAKNNG